MEKYRAIVDTDKITFKTCDAVDYLNGMTAYQIKGFLKMAFDLKIITKAQSKELTNLLLLKGRYQYLKDAEDANNG